MPCYDPIQNPQDFKRHLMDIYLSSSMKIWKSANRIWNTNQIVNCVEILMIHSIDPTKTDRHLEWNTNIKGAPKCV